jgi:SepF-like predicted cell division protein (DUF552 family)
MNTEGIKEIRKSLKKERDNLISAYSIGDEEARKNVFKTIEKLDVLIADLKQIEKEVNKEKPKEVFENYEGIMSHHFSNNE